jgi:chaperonin GroES
MAIPLMRKDRVLVKRLPEQAKTKGGIIIPDCAKEKPMSGEVVGCGPDVADRMSLTGANVLFSRYAGLDIRIGQEDFLILADSEILGVIPDA